MVGQNWRHQPYETQTVENKMQGQENMNRNNTNDKVASNTRQL